MKNYSHQHNSTIAQDAPRTDTRLCGLTDFRMSVIKNHNY